MSAQIIDGKGVAARLRKDLGEEVSQFREATGVVPHLAAILVGEDPASAVYVRNKQRACEKAGIKSTLHRLDAATTQVDLLELISGLNGDDSVHGILCQLPLPSQIDETTVLDSVTPIKDVDCFHPENVGLMVQGRPRYLPCTPAGCQRLIAEAGVETSGAHAVIVGRSEIVGKPMGMMLVQKGDVANATVTYAHSRTKNLAEITRQADILVAAIGKPNFIRGEMVKPGACVIDVGINRVDEKLVGDVDFDSVVGIAGSITPVPGGVGPMTIAMLLQNTLTAAKLQAE
ncbi:bifunctional methylenetetrahydrofolate dehydrogenase/methenyltetrahydrofolate cyclohydrolase FolD [Thalassoglobus polymorphus]|uniref:Bifunctional protein FolD n=1 Tax=Thalassoglobus polymorphus TaxID=2527994 RepID=A0A517QL20_9PLAN|nr:bifunctional methylenetetrahydrofolate dehydrogenase/methenyltetrahydrofolate cyclohydrolase FolD [Thalassoglobus polymorphus]QDT32328.1 Tetrahydrofolate dehydrogenase/cyclohydrolase [Thalassoglobus polymorphus]